MYYLFYITLQLTMHTNLVIHFLVSKGNFSIRSLVLAYRRAPSSNGNGGLSTFDDLRELVAEPFGA